MARLVTRATTTPVTTVTQTTTLNASDLDQVVAEIQGITTGTVQVQVSLDGANWTNEGSALTADGRVVVSGLAAQVRADVTDATSVSVILTLGGREQPIATGTFG